VGLGRTRAAAEPVRCPGLCGCRRRARMAHGAMSCSWCTWPGARRRRRSAGTTAAQSYRRSPPRCSRTSTMCTTWRWVGMQQQRLRTRTCAQCAVGWCALLLPAGCVSSRQLRLAAAQRRRTHTCAASAPDAHQHLRSSHKHTHTCSRCCRAMLCSCWWTSLTRSRQTSWCWVGWVLDVQGGAVVAAADSSSARRAPPRCAQQQQTPQCCGC
jgi:hypothetical protein